MKAKILTLIMMALLSSSVLADTINMACTGVNIFQGRAYKSQNLLVVETEQTFSRGIKIHLISEGLIAVTSEYKLIEENTELGETTKVYMSLSGNVVSIKQSPVGKTMVRHLFNTTESCREILR